LPLPPPDPTSMFSRDMLARRVTSFIGCVSPSTHTTRSSADCGDSCSLRPRVCSASGALVDAATGSSDADNSRSRRRCFVFGVATSLHLTAIEAIASITQALQPHPLAFQRADIVCGQHNGNNEIFNVRAVFNSMTSSASVRGVHRLMSLMVAVLQSPAVTHIPAVPVAQATPPVLFVRPPLATHYPLASFSPLAVAKQPMMSSLHVPVRVDNQLTTWGEDPGHPTAASVAGRGTVQCTAC
jgi:hypothetical protein